MNNCFGTSFKIDDSLTLPDPLERRLFDAAYRFWSGFHGQALVELSSIRSEYPRMSARLQKKFRLTSTMVCTFAPHLLFPLNAKGFREPSLILTVHGFPLPTLSDTQDAQRMQVYGQQILGHCQDVTQRRKDLFREKVSEIDYKTIQSDQESRIVEFFHIVKRLDDLIPVPYAHLGIRHWFLLNQRYEEAWQIYRPDEICNETLKYANRCWKGESLKGKRVMFWLRKSRTAGFGDCINFIWLVRELEKLGAEVYVAASESIRELIQYSMPEIKVWDKQPFDFMISSWESLLQHLKYSPQKYRAPRNYLKVPPSKINLSELERSLGIYRKMRVGLVWYASDYKKLEEEKSQMLAPIGFRSFDFELLKDFFELKDSITFYTVQPDKKVIEDTKGYPVINLAEHIDIKNWSDTAAILNQLDLVIGTDTAIGHLAGAIGKPAWKMLLKNPDHRWGLEGSWTHWYPSVRLFRQEVDDDWVPLIAEVREELAIACQKFEARYYATA